MGKLLRKLRDLFCYCGLSKEEYKTLRQDAYQSNFTVWKYLHTLLFVLFLGLFLYFFATASVPQQYLVQLGMMIYFGFTTLMFFFVLKKGCIAAQIWSYFTMLLLMLSALGINRMHPRDFSVTFIVLIVTWPLFMIDRSYHVAFLNVCASVVYLSAIHVYKMPQTFRNERTYIIAYGAAGIVINLFYNYLRMNEFRFRRLAEEHSREEKRVSEEAVRLNKALKSMSESALELLGDIVEGRDTDSGEHIRRVKGFTYILAGQVMQDLPEYHLDSYTVDLIAYTSALHDVGKISIPDAILCKPGKLTKEEFEVMKTHCEKGCAILGKMGDKWSKDYLDMGMTICMSHHEKWDGRGYPQGLKGDEIPIAAQIVSVADIFDALTTKRCYKDAYSYEQAYEMIISGECGAFSEKLLTCFIKCYGSFVEHAEKHQELTFEGRNYELVSRAHPDESFVIGLHDNDKTLREKLRLDEEVSVFESLSETFCYVCYVNITDNTVTRFRADKQFARILDSYGTDIPSNERFDKLLNSIIAAEDYAEFRRVTERGRAMRVLSETGHLTTDFRIRLEDGVHYCRMRISLDRQRPDAVIIGIFRRDEEHRMETEYAEMQHQLETARREMENREKLEDRLAVIDCVSSEYDYVCSLNADTMDVVVYRAEDWIRDMFKNLEDIVVSSEVRNTTLKGIIHKDDFERFQRESRHESVLAGLAGNGVYTVNYRANRYGQLLNYQTRYTLDKNNPKRIIIGLRALGAAEPPAETPDPSPALPDMPEAAFRT